MVRKRRGVFLSLVVLVVIAALTVGSSGRCCIGSICLFGGGEGDSATGNQVSWSTDVVSLQCADFSIMANAQVFSAGVDQVSVHSYTDDVNHCTLDVTWQEYGVEMGLFMSFRSDETKWWSDEVSTYDGLTEGGRISYTGKFFETSLGEAFTGSLDITGESPVSMVHFGGLNLQAFLPAAVPEAVAQLTLNKPETTIEQSCWSPP